VAGCGLVSEDDDGDGGQEKVGSGIGWFFLVLFLAFLAYFGLGAYYNYTTYGASGVDLIPYVIPLPFALIAYISRSLDTGISGKKSHTWHGMSSRTYVRLDNGGRLQEEGISLFDRAIILYVN
jgi:hypothetical protein